MKILCDSAGNLERKIDECKINLRKLSDEIRWVNQQFPSLPFLKRLSTINALISLKTEANLETQKLQIFEEELTILRNQSST